MKVCDNISKDTSMTVQAKTVRGRIERKRNHSVVKKDKIKSSSIMDLPLPEVGPQAREFQRMEMVPEQTGSMYGTDMEETCQEPEILECLSKLQQLVPSTPKDKSVSNLEVITSAIYYIKDLMDTLGFPSCQPQQPEEPVQEDITTLKKDPRVLERTSDFEFSPSGSLTSITPSMITCTLLSPSTQSASNEVRSPQRSNKRQPLSAIHSPGNTVVSSITSPRLLQKS